MTSASQPAGIEAGYLAIDTSTEMAGIALATSNGVRTRVWSASRAQTTTVLPEIDRLFVDNGMEPRDLRGLIVATGPGTFTGLRVGLAIAKGMLAARAMPLVGIPTLDIVLASQEETNVMAVLPAGRGRVVWQRRSEGPRNTTVNELISELAATSETLLVGELPDAFAEQISQSHSRVVNAVRDPSVLLRLGAARIAADDLDDPVTLEPTYLHGITVNAPVIEDRLKRA